MMQGILLALVSITPIVVGATIGALSMRRISVTALEGITRQPEVAGQLFTAMLIGMALVEALVIYCLVVALMLAGSVKI
jgi:F-type H+-transporting ATPase subunit c